MDFTYPAKIESVARTSSTAYAVKGESEQGEGLTVTVAYGTGANDQFMVKAEGNREAMIVGREVEVILRVPPNAEG